METETKSRGFEVVEGRIKLIVPHKDGNLTFAHPSYGPGNYFDVKRAIESEGLTTPTMGETASFVHAGFNSDDKYGNEVRKIMSDRWFWGFTGSLYVPKGKGDFQNGVIIQENPEAVDEKLTMDKNSLVKKLEANDKSVRFVPFGYKTGEQTSRELEKNPYVIGLAGREGAEKLAEIADNYKKKPFLYSFDSVDEEKARVSALGRGWLFDGRLVVDGDDRGGNGGGGSFGVLPAEKSKA